MTDSPNIPLELDLALHEAIKTACAKGDRLLEIGNYKQAIQSYNVAWKLVPDPKTEWSASTWILTAIADAAFQGRFLESARQAIDYVMACPGAIGNPFIHLRRGQILFEQGELEASANELARAYMSEGDDIFAPEEKKYLQFLKTKIAI